MKYIDADRLRAMITKYQSTAENAYNPSNDDADYWHGKVVACEDILFDLDMTKEEIEKIGHKELITAEEYNSRSNKMSNKTLDEAAHSYAWEKQEHHINFDGDEYLDYRPRYDAFKAGAKWMAGQGVTLKVTDDTTWGEVNDFIHRNCDGAKEIQIRKKED